MRISSHSMVFLMNVGVYIDGYNLYYGGRRLCGKRDVSWKWLDVRSLSKAVLADQLLYASNQNWFKILTAWSGAQISRVVYCTARIDSRQNPSGQADQDVYLKALVAGQAVDHIEYGNYVSRAKVAPLAIQQPSSGKESQPPAPKVMTSRWPVMVKDHARQDVPDAIFMVQYLHNEEKGSDVNVASHLLTDVLGGEVDAAIVISNDSDLRYPVAKARERIPVGIVNPRGGMTAGDLKAPHRPGDGPHWTRKLRPADFVRNQLPNPAGSYSKPPGW